MTGRIPPDVHIGRICLRVRDIDRVVSFYRNVIGLVPHERADGTAVVGSKTEPLIILETSSEQGEDNRAGLYHLAIRVPDREALGSALERIEAAEGLDGASDHGFSEALYFRDPEGNGIEMYTDRAREDWPRHSDGTIRALTRPLETDKIRTMSDASSTVPSTTDIGHVHLAVTDVDRSLDCYRDTLGLALTMRPTNDVAFVSAGGYHHHIAMNTWERRENPAGGLGLSWFELVFPTVESRELALDRLARERYSVNQAGAPPSATDPDGIRFKLTIES